MHPPLTASPMWSSFCRYGRAPPLFRSQTGTSFSLVYFTYQLVYQLEYQLVYLIQVPIGIQISVNCLTK